MVPVNDPVAVELCGRIAMLSELAVLEEKVAAPVVVRVVVLLAPVKVSVPEEFPMLVPLVPEVLIEVEPVIVVVPAIPIVSVLSPMLIVSASALVPSESVSQFAELHSETEVALALPRASAPAPFVSRPTPAATVMFPVVATSKFVKSMAAAPPDRVFVPRAILPANVLVPAVKVIALSAKAIVGSVVPASNVHVNPEPDPNVVPAISVVSRLSVKVSVALPTVSIPLVPPKIERVFPSVMDWLDPESPAAVKLVNADGALSSASQVFAAVHARTVASVLLK
jgi:hypothetical protein